MFKFIYNIPYNLIKVSYNHKIYGRGNITIILELKNNKEFIAEIKQIYNIGWTNEEIK